MCDRGGPYAAACITGSRLDEQAVKWAFVQAPAIRDYVQRDSSGHTKVVCIYLAVKEMNLVEEHLLQRRLYAARDIHVNLPDFRFRRTGAFAE
jgi:hypothetical protein